MPAAEGATLFPNKRNCTGSESKQFVAVAFSEKVMSENWKIFFGNQIRQKA